VRPAHFKTTFRGRVLLEENKEVLRGSTEAEGRGCSLQKLESKTKHQDVGLKTEVHKESRAGRRASRKSHASRGITLFALVLE